MDESNLSDGTIIEFLLGEKSFAGTWFGEKNIQSNDKYWWRQFLMDYIANQNSRNADPVEITIHNGYAIGGPQILPFDSLELAISHMKTLGRVERHSDTSYYIYTERSTMIPVSVKKITRL